jgi:putative ABC transport system ATP-binding protein
MKLPARQIPRMAVSCRNLVKAFASEDGAVMALNSVNFEVGVGELVILVGPSGCGKTTLVSTVAALTEPNSGECDVMGRNIRQLSARERSDFRREKLGFVFQSFHLVPTVSVIDNVAVPLLLAGKSRKRAYDQAAKILEKLGIGHKLSARPFQLSGGQQQRVAIARALVHEPPLVLCDEPTSALDQATGRIVMRIFRECIRKRGVSMVVVSHDNRIFPYADRIVEMDDGKIISSVAQKPSTEIGLFVP